MSGYEVKECKYDSCIDNLSSLSWTKSLLRRYYVSCSEKCAFLIRKIKITMNMIKIQVIDISVTTDSDCETARINNINISYNISSCQK